uniref:PH domain-containing protein n=1 Tax=Chromera velia CCMP2878 TaxID=1169474 RepID=A0A0G4HUP9_9ALVE|eukprot:Cvel_8692.t1-p1 / transcript=Cvel_8692.t1 / gene=Cvel_8692 / organism=Chromera_velia_CCMP2878 / gene_product=hypothetical protein / transcript_product=hypothetical protein / location=Cvel_scaffold485:15575-18214(+) / protein_length=880 / sequence_SO=supercontig / SO=protein_coding / is_pseudo=false
MMASRTPSQKGTTGSSKGGGGGSSDVSIRVYAYPEHTFYTVLVNEQTRVSDVLLALLQKKLKLTPDKPLEEQSLTSPELKHFGLFAIFAEGRQLFENELSPHAKPLDELRKARTEFRFLLRDRREPIPTRDLSTNGGDRSRQQPPTGSGEGRAAQSTRKTEQQQQDGKDRSARKPTPPQPPDSEQRENSKGRNVNASASASSSRPPVSVSISRSSSMDAQQLQTVAAAPGGAAISPDQQSSLTTPMEKGSGLLPRGVSSPSGLMAPFSSSSATAALSIPAASPSSSSTQGGLGQATVSASPAPPGSAETEAPPDPGRSWSPPGGVKGERERDRSRLGGGWRASRRSESVSAASVTSDSGGRAGGVGTDDHASSDLSWMAKGLRFGVLEKLSKDRVTWKTVHGSLQSEALWYCTLTPSGSSMSGLFGKSAGVSAGAPTTFSYVSLGECSKVLESREMKRVFVLHSRSRTYTFRARSTTDRDGWLLAIAKQQALIREGQLIMDAEEEVRNAESKQTRKQLKMLLELGTFEGVMKYPDARLLLMDFLHELKIETEDGERELPTAPSVLPLSPPCASDALDPSADSSCASVPTPITLEEVISLVESGRAADANLDGAGDTGVSSCGDSVTTTPPPAAAAGAVTEPQTASASVSIPPPSSSSAPLDASKAPEAEAQSASSSSAAADGGIALVPSASTDPQKSREALALTPMPGDGNENPNPVKPEYANTQTQEDPLASQSFASLPAVGPSPRESFISMGGDEDAGGPGSSVDPGAGPPRQSDPTSVPGPQSSETAPPPSAADSAVPCVDAAKAADIRKRERRKMARAWLVGSLFPLFLASRANQKRLARIPALALTSPLGWGAQTAPPPQSVSNPPRPAPPLGFL